ncbi:E3 ubiquitin-protein ligase NEURL3 [Talpa occidentalis]|uniref:E3 ubiquitin-protein ligase NEURL3 n=1 Tax=Talpa occidentalis TaxID=50954 RepID=UPI00188DD3B5|nr:E3 ubiquitin-protein ligase NEURL3 [Talpa occidentalis]
MGAKLCSQADPQAPRERLLFHTEAKGAQVRLEAGQSTARRHATFHDGIVFSARPVQPCEPVALRVLHHECRWRGGLRVGFTRLDPARLCSPSLPPFLCPDLEQQSPTWAAVLPDHCVLPGNVVCFWVNSRGWLFVKVNSNSPLRLRTDVAVGDPLWAVMDLYGTTKAIELLDPTAGALPTATPKVFCDDFLLELKGCPPLSLMCLSPVLSLFTTTAGEKCVICYEQTANTCLVPCGHSRFCHCCAWQVLRDTATCPLCRYEIKAMAQARGPPAPGTTENLAAWLADWT